MNLIDGKLIAIRNYLPNDISVFKNLIDRHILDEEIKRRFITLFDNSYSCDFNSDGENIYCISQNGNNVGNLHVNIAKPIITFNFVLDENHCSRIYVQDLVISLVNMLHLIYPHREIDTSISKFKLVERAIYENLGFSIKVIDHNSNTYTYKIFIANLKKDK